VEKEESLLHNIAQGDRTAMKRLYDRYSGYAMSVGLRYVPEKDAVRDVVQDSFVKIFTSIGSFEFRGEGSLKAWITRIVANEGLDHIRKNSRITFTDDIPDNADEGEPPVSDVPPDVLTRMIGQLPMGYRLVLNMFVFEQKSHKQIAMELGIKENSSASQFFRAKKMLAQMIRNYEKRKGI